ncbi:hypothetical protein V6Z12_D09G066000 [Gossypium hirsutum]
MLQPAPNLPLSPSFSPFTPFTLVCPPLTHKPPYLFLPEGKPPPLSASYQVYPPSHTSPSSSFHRRPPPCASPSRASSRGPISASPTVTTGIRLLYSLVIDFRVALGLYTEEFMSAEGFLALYRHIHIFCLYAGQSLRLTKCSRKGLIFLGPYVTHLAQHFNLLNTDEHPPPSH